jgi:tetratricopeptide (TPR) repeat protein
MKRILVLLIFIFPFMVSAQSPRKLIDRGEFDEAIVKCVDKLERGKRNKDQLYASLKYAFEAANREDMQQLTELKASGEPDVWFDVFRAYYRLQERYRVVSAISGQLEQDRVNIQLNDFSEDLESSRQHAAAYLYAHALSLLKTGDRADAGQAYTELLKITKLYEEYKDVDLLLRHAIGGSAAMAGLKIKNRSRVSLPEEITAELGNIELSPAEKDFLDYAPDPPRGQPYSLILNIELNRVKVTPGTLSEKEYTTSHKNPESFAEAYEDKEKFEEDKKHPDFNTCQVTEIYQVKSAMIAGKLSYIDRSTGKVMYEVPVTVRSVFENKTATATGDMFACPPEIKAILDNPKKKFPDNREMVWEAARKFKLLVKDIVWDKSFINKKK